MEKWHLLQTAATLWPQGSVQWEAAGLHPCRRGVIISLLQMKALRPREMQRHGPNRTLSKWPRKDSNPGLPDLQPQESSSSSRRCPFLAPLCLCDSWAGPCEQGHHWS